MQTAESVRFEDATYTADEIVTQFADKMRIAFTARNDVIDSDGHDITCSSHLPKMLALIN